MITPDMASAHRFGTTFSGQGESSGRTPSKVEHALAPAAPQSALASPQDWLLMPMQTIEQPDTTETTYKIREVEGVLDLYFYRRIGYWLAQAFVRLKITPAGVSLLGALCGV